MSAETVLASDTSAQALKLIADKLGVASEHLWGALVRQAAISSSVDLAVLVAGVFGLKWAFGALRRNTKDMDIGEPWKVLGWAAWGFMAFLMFVIIAANTSNIMAGFFNPEYWALKDVLSCLKPK